MGKTCYIVKLHYCYRHGDARRRHGNTVSDAFKERGPGRCLAVHGLAFFLNGVSRDGASSPSPHSPPAVFKWIRIAQGWNDFKNQLSNDYQTIKTVIYRVPTSSFCFLFKTSAARFSAPSAVSSRRLGPFHVLEEARCFLLVWLDEYFPPERKQ